MATNGDLERQFQERIARAQEAARLASIAATARGSSEDAPPAPRGFPVGAPPPRPPPPPPLVGTFRDPPRGPPPPFLARGPPPLPVDAATVPETVRHRIDRLVEFIARNGPAFEETARERERDNPDFAFLHNGAPFHDYFVWRKAQAKAPPTPPHLVPPMGVPPRPLASSSTDPVMSVSVGAMANACKAARARGFPAYTPLPPELLVSGSSTVTPVEPARLEARLAEFYRSSSSSS